ncbi:MAG TPA: very short patch repair endonuclease [Verrucomicrobiales bacterium]|nr:very short patch repair endonuclease [Verrucomicrobiales bacterium]
MTDIWTPGKRSSVMRNVRSSGNQSTELTLIDIFRAAGLCGWRRNQRLPGKPDFVFRRERVAVFVDGCFWHGCPKCYRRPKSNRKFWDEKVARNKKRDREVGKELRGKNWRVIRIWEHQLKNRARVANRFVRALAVGQN